MPFVVSFSHITSIHPTHFIRLFSRFLFTKAFYLHCTHLLCRLFLPLMLLSLYQAFININFHNTFWISVYFVYLKHVVFSIQICWLCPMMFSWCGSVMLNTLYGKRYLMKLYKYTINIEQGRWNARNIDAKEWERVRAESVSIRLHNRQCSIWVCSTAIQNIYDNRSANSNGSHTENNVWFMHCCPLFSVSLCLTLSLFLVENVLKWNIKHGKFDDRRIVALY